MQICYNRQQEKPAVSDPKKGFYMRNAIDIDIQIDPACAEPKVIIRTERMTPEIDGIEIGRASCRERVYVLV